MVREKPHQHATGLLLFDDTGKCPIQSDEVSGGTDARHGAWVQSPLCAVVFSRQKHSMSSARGQVT
jgi:hypothetical protein